MELSCVGPRDCRLGGDRDNLFAAPALAGRSADAGPCARRHPGLPIQLPVGDVHLDIDEPQLDEKMGGAFALGLRSGANRCYVQSELPLPEGEITFTVKPPPQEGKFLVALEKTGSINDALVACVKGVFGSFYHYGNKKPFDQVQGTLTFTPHLITAPPPPTDTELRAQLDEQYSQTPIVRIAKAD